MTGFLLDENLPNKLRFIPSYPVTHARDLGKSLSDGDLWRHARANNLVIVTKDADFADRILTAQPPPKIVHLRFGNIRLAEFHAHLIKVWFRTKSLLETNKLVNVYLDRLEAVA